MLKKQKKLSEQARMMIGHPVCVELNNGSFYVGRIMGVEKGQLILSGKKGKGKLKSSSSKKQKRARISAILPEFGSPVENFGGGAPFAPGSFNHGPFGLGPFGNVNPQAVGNPGFSGGFGSFGGGGGGGGAGFGGMMQFMKKAWPMVNMGMGVIKSIIPFVGLFK